MRSIFVLALMAAANVSTAYAADLLPVGALDHQATAGVSKVKASDDGQVKSLLNVDNRSSLAGSKALIGGESNGHEALREAQTMGLLIGLGINQSLDLSLGFHATDEHMSSGYRDRLFPQDNAYDGWRGNFRQTAFSGLSFLLKYNLLASDGLRLAVAPFVESGTGDRASYSLTRSVGPKAGLLGIVSYGAPGVAELSINLGRRYRDPETLASTTIRHETFTKVLVEAYLSRSSSLFFAAEGRRLQVADGTGGATTANQVRNEAGAQGGFKFAVGDATVGAYVGGKLGERDMLGYGKRSFGLSLAYDFGNLNGQRKPKTNYAKQIERAQAADALKNPRASKQPQTFMEQVDAAFPAQGDYSEMKTQGSQDVLEEASASIVHDEDFKSAEKSAASHQLKAGEMSDDEKVRQELEAIKAAEALAEEERAQNEAREEEKARKVRLKKAREDEKLMREWMEEAQKDADSMYGIDDDEMTWQGLED